MVNNFIRTVFALVRQAVTAISVKLFFVFATNLYCDVNATKFLVLAGIWD